MTDTQTSHHKSNNDANMAPCSELASVRPAALHPKALVEIFPKVLLPVRNQTTQSLVETTQPVFEAAFPRAHHHHLGLDRCDEEVEVNISSERTARPSQKRRCVPVAPRTETVKCYLAWTKGLALIPSATHSYLSFVGCKQTRTDQI